ncbi:MAG: tetratricopeptide repeat protein [Calditrichia bacterium]
MFDFLTGNVPGGFGLYLLFIIVVFLVLRGMSRQNELFTPRLFRIWFFAIWGLATLVYGFLWLSDPPPQAFSRYSVQFYAENPADKWLAYYFRDEMERSVESQRNPTNYYYDQRWNYLAGADCATFEASQCATIAEQMPVDELVTGTIRRENGNYQLALTFRTFPGNRIKSQKNLPFPSGEPEKAIAALQQWIGEVLPLKEKLPQPLLADSLFVLARDHFWRNDYQKSLNLCREALNLHPDNAYIKYLLLYNRIRIANDLSLKHPVKNPYETKLNEWQRMLVEARQVLIPAAQANYDAGLEDPLLSNMIAESFMPDQQFGDAEAFLKIAFGEDPLNLEVLKNLLALHPSRYHDLPFESDGELMARILNICPFDAETLRRYIENLLVNLQVDNQPAAEIRYRLDRALALAPDNYTALLLKGKFHLTLFEYEPAIAAFEHADRVMPDRSVTHYNLGIAYYLQKQPDRAETHFQKAVDLDDYLDAHLYLGVIFQERGEFEKALAQFRYRVAHKTGSEDYYAIQAMKGIRECLKALNIPIPGQAEGSN